VLKPGHFWFRVWHEAGCAAVDITPPSFGVRSATVRLVQAGIFESASLSAALESVKHDSNSPTVAVHDEGGF